MVRTFALLALVALPLLPACSEYDLSGPGGVVNPGNERTGTLRGRICGPDGEHWVVAAEVDIDHGDGTHSTTLTDDEGWFELEAPVGDWLVVVSKGSFSIEIPVTIVEDQVTELPEEECIEQGEVRIGVVTGEFDHIEHLLDDMGLEYTLIDSYYEGTDFLRDPARLAEFDIIFFNCGMDDSWTWTYKAEVAQNLKDFVTAGGSIYASDWAYYIVEAGWPDMNTFYGDDNYPGDAYVGESAIVTADVLDPVMAARLGSNTAVLDYNLPSWAVMEQTHHGDVLIEGSVEIWDWSAGYTTIRAPLASRLVDGDGSVLYTTFHNEAQTTLDMELLLQEIILSL